MPSYKSLLGRNDNIYIHLSWNFRCIAVMNSLRVMNFQCNCSYLAFPACMSRRTITEYLYEIRNHFCKACDKRSCCSFPIDMLYLTVQTYLLALYIAPHTIVVSQVVATYCKTKSCWDNCIMIYVDHTLHCIDKSLPEGSLVYSWWDWSAIIGKAGARSRGTVVPQDGLC